ncbi:hypothetical protein [Pontibacter ramchanderi]|uniref:Rho-binding antiterminator n=1 Tax=Pontibacter ramchanderi TaxID=1179743 RepID=A0A2N3V305_9BACT|nr:hypothetical protein [Pontibacter ramchanderi]PKV76010.1 Rho-binding antiterminator [Pontibacter ramchanderi]
MASSYQPIDQAYHALLTSLVSKRAAVRLQFYSDIGEFLTLHATLKELMHRDGAEYLVLTTGEEIRLDRLVRIDDKPAPGYDESFFQCDIR